MTTHAPTAAILASLAITLAMALTGCTTSDTGTTAPTASATPPRSTSPSTTASSTRPPTITEAEIGTCGIANYLKTKHGKVLRAASRDSVGYSLDLVTRTDLTIISGELAKLRPAEPLAGDGLQLATALTNGINGDLLFAQPAAQALELIATVESTCEEFGIPFGRFPKP